jgi:hypothetical protein
MALRLWLAGGKNRQLAPCFEVVNFLSMGGCGFLWAVTVGTADEDGALIDF